MQNSFSIGKIPNDGPEVWTVHKDARPLCFIYSLNGPADECADHLVDVRCQNDYDPDLDQTSFPWAGDREYHLEVLSKAYAAGTPSGEERWEHFRADPLGNDPRFPPTGPSKG